MFKSSWEKANENFTIKDEVIADMLNSIYDISKVSSYNIISGGCSNLNLKIELPKLEEVKLLRIYSKDTNKAYIEQKMWGKLQGVVKVPQVHHVGYSNGYLFALEEFIAGSTLREFLKISNKKDIEKIMFKIGQVLFDISMIKFDKYGFFNKELEVSDVCTKNSYKKFCQDALDNQNVREVLSREQCFQISNLIYLCEILVSDTLVPNLVHGDFDPANILINTNNSEAEIAGIIDWEFAFSGSSLTDIANMLRYSHQMPEYYEQSFLQGLTSKGYVLSENWRVKINMYNLLALLDCIMRSNIKKQPKRIQDIKSLIAYILNKLEQFYKNKFVQLSEHNPDWPKLYEIEAIKIANALKENLVSIHHIGSTSIPDLLSKPTIDIIAEIKDINFEHKPLLDLNYKYRGGFNIPLRQCFTSSSNNFKVNLHIFERNDPEIELNILFRDYLRANKNIRKEYQNIKYSLANQEVHDTKQVSMYKQYTLGKNNIINKILHKTNFNKIRFVFCTHHSEWEKVKELRNKYFFNPLNILDPYTWTFDHKNHKHFVLYKGADIIGYSHLQLWPEKRAALRIITIDEMHRGESYGREFIHLIEKWLRYMRYNSIHVESSEEAFGFYKKLKYIPMEFNDPYKHDYDPRDIPLGKIL